MLRFAATVVIFVSSYIFIDYTLNKGGDRAMQAGVEKTYDNIDIEFSETSYFRMITTSFS